MNQINTKFGQIELHFCRFTSRSHFLREKHIYIKFLVRLISFLYVCMVNTVYLLSFVETPRKCIIAELSIRKLGSSSVLIIRSSSVLIIFILLWLYQNNKINLISKKWSGFQIINAIDTLYQQARAQRGVFGIIFPVYCDTINLN